VNDRTWSYRGEIENNKWNGLGIYTEEDNLIYFGQFAEDEFDGYGLVIMDGISYFTKWTMGDMDFKKKIEGLEIDTSVFFN
jgi:hypothetical protein